MKPSLHKLVKELLALNPNAYHYVDLVFDLFTQAYKLGQQSSLLDILKEAERRVEGKKRKFMVDKDNLSGELGAVYINNGLDEALSVIREMMK